MTRNFSRQIYEKYSNTKFHKNPYIGRRVVTCRQTDRHGKAGSKFTKFYERAPKFYCTYKLFPGTGCSRVPAVPHRYGVPTRWQHCCKQPQQRRVLHLELSEFSDQSPDISDSTVQSGTVTPVIPFQYNSSHRSITA